MARRHGHTAPVGIKTIVYHLRGRLSGPRHSSYGLRIRLENDVDLCRTHRIAGVRRVVARHGLQKDAFGQPHAFIVGELGGGHDLAARDPRHVGNDRLDLGNTVVAKELLNFTHHIRAFYLCCARSRLATPNAANIARDNESLITCHSGCHWTANAKHGASLKRNASITPSGARASTTKSAARRSTPCECSELTFT